jgi:hypothetical protein
MSTAASHLAVDHPTEQGTALQAAHHLDTPRHLGVVQGQTSARAEARGRVSVRATCTHNDNADPAHSPASLTTARSMAVSPLTFSKNGSALMPNAGERGAFCERGLKCSSDCCRYPLCIATAALPPLCDQMMRGGDHTGVRSQSPTCTAAAPLPQLHASLPPPHVEQCRGIYQT